MNPQENMYQMVQTTLTRASSESPIELLQVNKFIDGLADWKSQQVV